MEEDGICGSVIPETKTEGAGRAAAAGDPRLEADAETGLSAAQAQERLDGGWGNAPVESPGASVREIIAKRFLRTLTSCSSCWQAV